MLWLLIIPAILVYTFLCGLIIHLISDRINRKARRRATYIRKLYNGREAKYRV